MISGLIFNNWQRKLAALLVALVIWWFVNNSIVETKTITNVPIRIVNLPPNKTVVGLLPNRLLSKRVSLTLNGTKDVIQELGTGDVEVLLDVSAADSDEWVVHIGKKNLISLNPSIDLAHDIHQVDHSELVLKLSPLKTAKVPIRVVQPLGDAPQGYEFLDIWPQKLMQTVTGSVEEVAELEAKGIKLQLNLNDVTKEDLDALIPTNKPVHEDEISFPVPEKWKKVVVNQTPEEINDPDAQHMTIDFLRKGSLPVEKALPIRVFYPLNTIDTINEHTFPLATNDVVQEKNGINIFTYPVQVKDVSRLFLDVISDNLEIDIVAAPKSEREVLQWSLEVIDPRELEDTYVAYLQVNGHGHTSKRRDFLLRQRFHTFLKRLAVYNKDGVRLPLEAKLGQDKVEVKVQE